jgi:CrcB protein
VNIVLVAVGGGLGAACRYAVSSLAAKWPGGAYSWGTTAVNIVGCLAIGVAAGLLERSAMSRTAWLLLVTGFLGGFTTFSSFSLEVLQGFRQGSSLAALAVIAVNVVGGLMACAFGLWASRFLTGTAAP